MLHNFSQMLDIQKKTKELHKAREEYLEKRCERLGEELKALRKYSERREREFERDDEGDMVMGDVW